MDWASVLFRSPGRLENLFLPSTDMFPHAGFRRNNIKSAQVFNQ
jgi:hypothetical protein